jgi:hypothetical protein
MSSRNLSGITIVQFAFELASKAQCLSLLLSRVSESFTAPIRARGARRSAQAARPSTPEAPLCNFGSSGPQTKALIGKNARNPLAVRLAHSLAPRNLIPTCPHRRFQVVQHPRSKLHRGVPQPARWIPHRGHRRRARLPRFTEISALRQRSTRGDAPRTRDRLSLVACVGRSS